MKELKLLAIIVVAVMALMGSCAIIQMRCAAPAMGAAYSRWICMASASDDCDATGRGSTRKKAESSAMSKCKSKCPNVKRGDYVYIRKCRIEACIRRR